MAVRDAGGGSAETNASWCCDGGGTLCDETRGNTFMRIVSFKKAIEMEERTSGLKMQLGELMTMDGIGHGVVTMLVQLGSLGRQRSSYCKPYRGPVRCGRQGLQLPREGPLLWRCSRQARKITDMHSVYISLKGGANDAPLSRKATLAMGIPWDGAKRRIWTQTDPLVTRPTEDAVGVKLSYVRV